MPSGGSNDHSQQAHNPSTNSGYSHLYADINIWNNPSPSSAFHGRGPSIGSRADSLDTTTSSHTFHHNHTDRQAPVWPSNARQNGDSSRPDSTSPNRVRENGFPNGSPYNPDPLPNTGTGLRNSLRKSRLSETTRQQQQPLQSSQGRPTPDSYFPPMGPFSSSAASSNPPSRQSQASPAFQNAMSNGHINGHSHSNSFTQRQSTNQPYSNATQIANNRAFNHNQQLDDGYSGMFARPRTFNGDAMSQNFEFNPSSQPWTGDVNNGGLMNGGDLNVDAVTEQLAAWNTKRPSADGVSPGLASGYRLETGNSPRHMGQAQNVWNVQSIAPRSADISRRAHVQQMPMNMAMTPYGTPFQIQAAQPQLAFDPYTHLRHGVPNYNFPIQTGFPVNNNLNQLRQQTNQDYMKNHRSAFLNEFLASNKASKRYELKDIYNYIVEFSGDQYGSRFIQSKLETANSDEKEQVFREIEPNAAQLMMDLFGNYVVQKFFEHGSQLQKKVLAEKLKGRIIELSMQSYACRVVQKALEHILVDQQVELVEELQPQVLAVAQDVSGNHVMQKIIEVVPRKHLDFVMDAFRGQVFEVSSQQYGCRVIQRLMEHGTDADKTAIMRELQPRARVLITDSFGNYVAQNIIEKGRSEDRQMMIDAALSDLVTNCKHKFASNVVEKCIKFGAPSVLMTIRDEFMKKGADGTSTLPNMIRDNYGNYVIKTLLTHLNGTDRAPFAEEIKPLFYTMKKSSSNGTQKQVQGLEELLGLGVNSSKPNRHSGDAVSMGSAPGLVSETNSTPSSPHSTSIDTPSMAELANNSQNVNGVKQSHANGHASEIEVEGATLR